jgi:diguanylate cyclase (GGDEF)-like protein
MQKSKFKVSLPLLLVAPFLLQIFVVVGITGWLSFLNGQKAVNEVASELRNNVSNRIQEEVTHYISLPPLVNQITADAIANGQINLENQDLVQKQLRTQVKNFTNISFHYLGKPSGEFLIAHKLPSQEIEVGISSSKTNQLNFFNASGDRLTESLTEIGTTQFDPRTQVWYATAIKAGKPTWTKIYRHFITKGLTISATQPVYSAQGDLLAVVSTDFVFLQINTFLRSLKIGRSSKVLQTFIIEKSGELISTSTDDPTFIIDGDSTNRLLAKDSKSEVLRAATQQLLKQKGNLDFQGTTEFEFNLNGMRQFAQVAPIKDGLGIDWLAIVVIPESSFMDKIQESTNTTIILCAIALIISAIIGTLVARKITKPILNLSLAVANLAHQQDGVSIPEVGIEELSTLANSFNLMSNQLESTFIDLHHSAYHDSLTNLPNRAAFLFSLENRIARRQVEPEYLFALLFLDLDRFKLVNDSLGHLMGDMLLVAVTQRLQSCLRKTDMLSRFGGDEFIILLHEIPNIEFASHFAQRIQNILNRPFELDGHQIYTSTSIGIVSPLNSTGSPQDFLRDADIALYQAKHEGKARSKIFDAAMHDQASALLQLEMDLRRAIALPINLDEFIVYYQPIVSIHNLAIVGCEALVRWNHPTRGLLSPARFLPVASDMGAITAIDWWVLKQACIQMQNWMEIYPDIPLKQISVNLSSIIFLQPQWQERINQILTDTGLAPHHLKLELVESTLMDSTDSTRIQLEQIRNSGIKLDIDDFGTGYSSLSYLCRFPLDTIKIDRSFITNLEKENFEIVKAIIVLARNLGMQTVAEGVETSEQLDILRNLGCDRVQGYFFSPPVPAAELIGFMV